MDWKQRFEYEDFTISVIDARDDGLNHISISRDDT